MKMVRASDEEVKELFEWFREVESRHSFIPDIEPIPKWERIVFGYQILVNNCADKSKDTLEFHPDILNTKTQLELLLKEREELIKYLDTLQPLPEKILVGPLEYVKYHIERLQNK